MSEAEPNPIVLTTAGAVRGVTQTTAAGVTQTAFLGIPYAEAPVGERRFAAPVPHGSWEGARDAVSYGATPLREFMTGITLIPEPAFPGEETLTVNVFTPRAGERDDPVPVLVWIHGGGFTTGSPSAPWYATGSFPHDGVVVVSLSYRLGVDGFGVIDGAPDNRAVRDWLLALEWVRDNIAAFGGDPARVTIAGQSAGGSAVLTLLSMPAAQPLFARAIAESPGSVNGDHDEVAASTKRLADRLGVPATRAGLSSCDERAVFTAQQKLGDEAGLPFVRRLIRGGASMLWQPVVDGDLIPHPIDTAFSRGIGADKPLLIGANAQEMDALFDDSSRLLDRLPGSLALLVAGFTPAAVRSYRARTPGTTRQLLGRIASDAVFRFAVARALATRRGATFAYDFRLPSALTGRSGHCLELPFVWDCLEGENVVAGVTGPNPPQALADRMHGDWLRFIRHGAAPWPAFEHGRRGMRFDAGSSEDSVFARELALVRP
ncbi:para-nitrobenzyl esterase [Paramicrobacterium humi]|uniref:Carboxylic ester hydrolase n=1 Tax=Paramicrobacterium humi TaxID=640635 RepID=A0A1H4LGS0_9MICO|nr:carboxylesterase family protein [Microbacterium humi]SEB69796.1 para-nitrobenzyl esterase [Microbacterium humi]